MLTNLVYEICCGLGPRSGMLRSILGSSAGPWQAHGLFAAVSHDAPRYAPLALSLLQRYGKFAESCPGAAVRSVLIYTPLRQVPTVVLGKVLAVWAGLFLACPRLSSR